MSNPYEGIVTPLLSIFTKDFTVNLEAQKLLTKHAMVNGANVLFLCGSTGEGQYIQKNMPEQRATIIKAAKKAMDELHENIPVIIGIFGDEAAGVEKDIEMILRLQETAIGDDIIDGFVLSPPLEHRLDDDDLRDYLDQIIQPREKPVFLYNNPSTFGNNNISISTYEFLIEKHDNIRGLKDSSPSLEYKHDIIKMIENINTINFYTGKEGDFFNCLKARSPENASQVGCIPSIGNVLDLPSRIMNAYLEGDVEYAGKLQEILNSIRNKIYHEPKTSGKAQRGGKFALSYIYKKYRLDNEVVVIPGFQREMKPRDKASMEETIDFAMKSGYIQKVNAK